jgi:Zn-dependent protease
MGLLSLLLVNPLSFLLLVIPLLYSVIAHEVAHGVVALLFGDDTAKRSGRLTLNPLSHLDPVGSLMLFLVGFGWARPVPVDYRRLMSMRAGMTCVALAGVMTNIFLAAVSLALLQSGTVAANSLFANLLAIMARINIILGAFNLIPIPPLDGSKVLMGLLPEKEWVTLARFEPYGFGLLLLMIVTGLLTPVIAIMEWLIFALLRLGFGLFG